MRYNKKHGEATTHLYKLWNQMRMRCINEKLIEYKNYGGRGITVCDEWNDYQTFRDWAMNNGYEFGLTLDRINNDREYSPDNCRWATRSEQMCNTRRNRVITWNGETHIMKEWAELLNIPYDTLETRLRRGWSVERAFTQSVQVHVNRRKTNNELTRKQEEKTKG